MSAKGGGTQGYRYLMSLLSGLCRGPIDELIEINVGDKQAWNGHACSDVPQTIAAPDLFGGDDKEGGIEGPFAVYMGDEDQVLPGAGGGLPSVKDAIGGLVSDMRGVVTVWFDGMVAAMNPYLKTWKFRVRRSRSGWYGGNTWYPEKATIFLGSDNLAVDTNRPIDFPVTADTDTLIQTITFSRAPQEGDTFTINGLTISIVNDNPSSYEIKRQSTGAKTIRAIANYVNARSTAFKATTTYDATHIRFTTDKAASEIYAMNAAHIIYESYTDPLWGRGFPRDLLDENSFIYAANTLCAEQFGLAIIWYRKEEIEQFIQKMCDLVGGLTYTDRETGKINFRLIRSDYDIDDLPHFTPESGLLGIDDDDSASADNAYNEIIGTSRDPVSNLDFQIRAQNLAALQEQGAVASLDSDYKGIPTKELLARVVTRDMRAMALGLKKYTVRLDRRAWRVAPGSVIRVSHPGRGIADLVLRVGEIDDGNLVNGEIKVKAAIDVFGLPATTYIDIVDNGWVAPSKIAVPAPDERLIEASYRDLYRMAGAGDAQAADPSAAYLGQLAVQPNATSLEYDLLTRADGEPDYVDRATGPFTGNARLQDAITPLQTAVIFNSRQMFDEGNVGQALFINDELVRLDTLDEATGEATITRGVGDTIPQAHAAATIAWTVDDDLVSDKRVYADGETVFAKVLTRTSQQVLDEALADEQELELVGRQGRPYPPANVKVGGISVFGAVGEQPEPVITWAERNRITQADVLTGHTEATIAPEVGTTYTARIYASDGVTLLRTEDGIVGGTWTYDATMQAADNPTSHIFVELESSRDDLASWQKYRFAIALQSGWGYGWGLNWGSPS
jgi:hypothetical protein